VRTFDEYSAEADRVWLPDTSRTLVDAIGLCAEAGEAADHFKKAVGHSKPLSAMEVGAELGDALWYLDRLAARAGFTLAEIAVMNVAKLRTRYPDGFQVEYHPKDEKKERVAMAIALRNHRDIPEETSSKYGLVLAADNRRSTTFWQDFDSISAAWQAVDGRGIDRANYYVLPADECPKGRDCSPPPTDPDHSVEDPDVTSWFAFGPQGAD
jgi:hypothetical protein